MIYNPSEDSYLMHEILKQKLPKLLLKNPNLKFLEIGSGSGIHLEASKKLGVKNILSVDINMEAVNHCMSLGFNCIHSDLFEKVKGRHDIIIFNPPYLPEDKREPDDSKLETTGGKKGSEVTNNFLIQAREHLNKDGKIFLITSSLASKIDWLDYKKIEVGCEKLFMEQLCIWELTL